MVMASSAGFEPLKMLSLVLDVSVGVVIERPEDEDWSGDESITGVLNPAPDPPG